MHAKNPQNKISQTSLKYYKFFINVINEALRQLKKTTGTVKKLKVETELKERDQKILELITIEII